MYFRDSFLVLSVLILISAFDVQFVILTLTESLIIGLLLVCALFEFLICAIYFTLFSHYCDFQLPYRLILCVCSFIFVFVSVFCVYSRLCVLLVVINGCLCYVDYVYLFGTIECYMNYELHLRILCIEQYLYELNYKLLA